jgi:hypothetical protein
VQKAISKYGLAAHLALLAVAPLFLFPFCGAVWTARVLLWLSFLAFVWTLVEPSRRQGEMLHDARFRVFLSVFRDPLFWFSLFLSLVAFVRWLNGGVAMAYDAENAVWSLRAPALAFLPGSVSGSGYLPFAATLAATVLMQGCRHALGRSARGAFLFIASFLAGVASVSAIVAAACGHAGVLAAAACTTSDATFVGNAFGLHLAGAMVALVVSFERKWKSAMPLLIVAIGGCGAGLYSFAPDYVIAVYALATVLALGLSLMYAGRKVGGLVVPKCLAILLISAAAGVLFAMWVVPASVREARFAFLSQEGASFLPDGFIAARDSLSAIAASVWKEHPWLGTGLGSFALDIRFNATPDDWALFPSSQAGALNGWWQMLAERGIAGVILFASPLLFLAWTYVLRAYEAVRKAVASRRPAELMALHAACWIGPLAIAATAACGFIDHSFWRPETMMAVAAMFALSGSALPAVAKKTDEESETEK